MPAPAMIRVAAVIAMLLLGWRLSTLALADHFAINDPERALRWTPGHPRALLAAAEGAAQSGNAKRAEELARAAFAANPLEGRALRILGATAEAAGQSDAALAYYERAFRLSPRDIPTHVWLEGHYLQSGKPELALRHIDLLLRIEPEKNWRQVNLLQAMATFPPAHAALAEALGTNPRWRTRFFEKICPSELGSSAQVAPLVGLLQSPPNRLSDPELSSWLNCLGRDEKWGEAYLTWAMALPAERQSQLTNVFNGSFEYEPSNLGFDWTSKPAPGFLMERLATEGASGEVALRVSFEDNRIQFNHLYQTVVLAPGAYTFTSRSKAEGLRTDRGLVWSVRCLGKVGEIAATEPLRGVSPWKSLTADFVVPQTGCAAQKILLHVPARTASERRIGGRAWFDDVKILRKRQSKSA